MRVIICMIKKFLASSVFLLIAALLIYAGWQFVHSKFEQGDEIPVFAMQTDTAVPAISGIKKIPKPDTTVEITTSETTTETTAVPTTTTGTIMTSMATEETAAMPAATLPPVGENTDNLEEELLPKPTGLFAEIEEVIMQYGRGVSVFYKDIVSGDEYFYNKERNYFIASIIKAPYAMFVYKCVLEKDFDTEAKFEYKRSHYYGGTGKIQEMEFGAEFTVEELIYYAIRWSDNIAMNMLMSIFPRAKYMEFVREIGLPHIADVRSVTNGNICAECAAVYIEAIYNFIEEGNQYSEDLKVHMLNTINRMIQADYPIVRKYGWTSEAFHDFAIIYNEKRPYLLAILSDRGKGDFTMFANISRALERYNNSKMIEAEEADKDDTLEEHGENEMTDEMTNEDYFEETTEVEEV